MIHRSYDPEVMREAFKMLEEDDAIPYDAWVSNKKNVMLVEGKNVGLATFDYPGLYTVHWFYEVRGRAAIKLARAMLAEMFEKYDARVIRGLTAKKLKAARWLAKQVGLKSYGDYTAIIDGAPVEHEIQCMTKEEFYGS